MKICTKCKEEKEYSEFYKNKKAKDGYRIYCKSCEKKYVEDNKEVILKRLKLWREENIELQKEYRDINKVRISEVKKVYRSNPENIEKQKEWRKNNPDKIAKYREKYSKSDQCKQHRKNWHRGFKERKPYVLAWRTLLNNTLKRFNKKKESETIKLLGYSALQLKEHIENLFLEGMNWENHGEWHIDHVKMVSDFDSETPMSVVNSLDNLRPLWAEDNCSRKFN
jgi:hypothetical protein